MKTKIFIFLLLSAQCLVAQLHPYEALMRLRAEKIVAFKEKLESELYRNSFSRFLGYASVATLVGGAVWYFALRTPEVTIVHTPGSHAPNLTEVPKAEMREIIRMYNSLYAKTQESNWFGLRTVYNWFKSQMNQVAVLCIFKGLNDTLGPIMKPVSFLNGIATRTINSVYHDGTLTWYIDSHTKMPLLLNELEAQAAVLGGHALKIPQQTQKTSLTPLAAPNAAALAQKLDHNYHRTLIASTWNMMINDLESILGFLSYKKQEVVRDSMTIVHRIEQAEQQIAKYVEETCLQLDEALSQAHDAQLLDIITQFRAKLNLEIQSYLVLEAL